VTAGRTFFNCDDAAYNVHIRQFLRRRFPERSRYEAGESPLLTNLRTRYARRLQPHPETACAHHPHTPLGTELIPSWKSGPTFSLPS
jgi:hypothetical protein